MENLKHTLSGLQIGEPIFIGLEQVWEINIGNTSRKAIVRAYSREECEANAKLLAHGADLLEALKLAYDLLEEHQGEAKWYLRGHYNKINTAIKKATE